MVCGLELFGPSPVQVQRKRRIKCDYDRGIHVLFLAIENKKWDLADRILRNNEIVGGRYGSWPRGKLLATTWVYRRSPKDGRVLWFMSCLHAAVIYDAPIDISVRVLEAYPGAVEMPDELGNLPLHLAYKRGLPAEKNGLRLVLLSAYPEGATEKNMQGLTPIECKKKEVDFVPETLNEPISQEEDPAVTCTEETMKINTEEAEEISQKAPNKQGQSTDYAGVQNSVVSFEDKEDPTVIPTKDKASFQKEDPTAVKSSMEEEGYFDKAMEAFVCWFDLNALGFDSDTVCTDGLCSFDEYTKYTSCASCSTVDGGESRASATTKAGSTTEVIQHAACMNTTQEEQSEQTSKMNGEEERDMVETARDEVMTVDENVSDMADDDVALNRYAHSPLDAVVSKEQQEEEEEDAMSSSSDACSAVSDLTPPVPADQAGGWWGQQAFACA